MATLEKIRNRAGVLVAVVIGLALIAFILGDMLNSGSVFFSSKKMEVADIDGNSISIQEYQREIDKLTEITKYSSQRSALDEQTLTRIREQTWQEMVRKYVLEDQYEELGIQISSEEVWDMVQGKNIHPIIQQLFTNPETGQLNTMAVIRFLKSYEDDPSGQSKQYWLFLEEQMVNQRKFTKYTNLIKKGLFATSLEAKAELTKNSKVVDFDFVTKNYASIADSLVSINDKEIKNYYAQNEDRFQQSASRDIEYVAFEVKPSEEDKQDTKQWIEDIRTEFEESSSPKEFVNINSDIPYDATYYAPEDVNDNLKEFVDQAKEGDVYGPYFEDDTYKLAKLADIAYLPDSVKARHVLLQPIRNQTQQQLMAVADSLKNELEAGANFSEVASNYSADEASAKDGGNLGWFRQHEMVSPFGDSTFMARTGEFVLVNTDYGIHIVQVQQKSAAKRKFQIAVLGRELTPSSKTYQETFSRASSFASNSLTYEEFNENLKDATVSKRIARNVQEEAKEIQGLGEARALIRNAYETEEGKLIMENRNSIFEIGDRFVIAFVQNVREEGTAPLEQVKSQITVQLRKDKKGEMLAEQMQGSDLNAIAQATGRRVQQASGVTYGAFNIPGLGSEPKVIGAVTALNENQITAPVIGNNGVTVAKVISVTEQNTGNPEMMQQRQQSLYENRASFSAFNALRESANIEDNRARFF
ncbi:MAG: SurA N-terminal domain-containing protein [Bacteroidales bacterium]